VYWLWYLYTSFVIWKAITLFSCWSRKSVRSCVKPLDMRGSHLINPPITKTRIFYSSFHSMRTSHVSYHAVTFVYHGQTITNVTTTSPKSHIILSQPPRRANAKRSKPSSCLQGYNQFILSITTTSHHHQRTYINHDQVRRSKR
jgi:hypothetical protein